MQEWTYDHKQETASQQGSKEESKNCERPWNRKCITYVCFIIEDTSEGM